MTKLTKKMIENIETFSHEILIVIESDDHPEGLVYQDNYDGFKDDCIFIGEANEDERNDGEFTISCLFDSIDYDAMPEKMAMEMCERLCTLFEKYAGLETGSIKSQDPYIGHEDNRLVFNLKI